jgi:hypothetical protein
MKPQILVKILNYSFNSFKLNGFFVNPLKLLEEMSEAINCTVRYPERDKAMVTFPDGESSRLCLTNSGEWRIIQ